MNSFTRASMDCSTWLIGKDVSSSGIVLGRVNEVEDSKAPMKRPPHSDEPLQDEFHVPQPPLQPTSSLSASSTASSSLSGPAIPVGCGNTPLE